MKKALFFMLMLFSLTSFGQNVGINKAIPNESLDVNGNVNVDGKLMINAVAGQPGQVLTTAASGATAWANPCNYTYASGFTQNGSFTVPAGVTRIMVEAWGAGGGGSSGGGGSAGMYIVSMQDVTPGQSIAIITGVGGDKATSFPGVASNGTSTTITGASPFTSIQAAGGLGAFSTAPAYAISYGTSNGKYIQSPGQAGDAGTVRYDQKNATTFTVITKYGDGGAAGPDYSRRSQGQTTITNESTGSTIQSNNPTFAPYPGGGGGGGVFGQYGGNGMVVIHY